QRMAKGPMVTSTGSKAGNGSTETGMKIDLVPICARRYAAGGECGDHGFGVKVAGPHGLLTTLAMDDQQHHCPRAVVVRLDSNRLMRTHFYEPTFRNRRGGKR